MGEFVSFPNISELIINTVRAFPQELSEKSSSLIESTSKGVVELLYSINLLELMRRRWIELVVEWPEVVELASKLAKGVELSEVDRSWLKELAEASGWDAEDLAEDLRNLSTEPSARAERYRKIFEKYYEEALRLAEKGDTQQAGEKIWGAVTALVKLHAARKGVPIVQWDHGKLYNYVSSSVERELREPFRNLLRAAEVLHKHFYEGHLDVSAFTDHFSDARRLIEEVRKALGVSPR